MVKSTVLERAVVNLPGATDNFPELNAGREFGRSSPFFPCFSEIIVRL